MTKFKLGRGTSADAIALMVIKLVTICLGFVVTRLLSQHLSTYDYGTYSQILLIASTISSLTILGMMDGVNYFFCREREESKRESYIATLFSLQCIVSTIAGGAVFLLKGVISAGFANPDVEKLVVFAAALPLLQNLVSMLQILMVSIGKARMIAIRNLIVSVARLAAVIIVVAIVQDVTVILTTTLVLDVVQIALFWLILRRNNCSLSLASTDFRLTRQILTYCVPMAVFTMINTLNRDCDKYLIALMTDTETLAIYTNASKALPFDIIMTSFCTVLQPEITRRVAAEEYEQAVSLYRVFLEIAYLSTGVLCCAALSAAPQLMELLYSEKYISGLPVFCIYILVDLIRFTNITLILSAAGKTKKLMLVGMGALAANAVLNVILYSVIGISGPAAATLIITMGTGVMMLSLGAKELNAKISALFEIRCLAQFAVENMAAVAVFWCLQRQLSRLRVHYFLILILVCGGYCLCMLLRNGGRLLRDLKWVNAAAK